MKKIVITFIALCSLFVAKATPLKDSLTGEKVLQKMYKKYKGNWYKNFTFTQTTETFKKDSLVKTDTWYESIVFPDYFRISIGAAENGNAVIYNKDSVFQIRKSKLVNKSLRTDDLTFLLGGMYFLPYDTVKSKILKEGYDYTKAYETTYNGKAVYVIGANNENEKVSQLFIEKERLIVVRFIKYIGKTKQEAIFDGHQKVGKAYTETIVSFYINDALLQKEKYYDCKFNTTIDMAIFDPYQFK